MDYRRRDKQSTRSSASNYNQAPGNVTLGEKVNISKSEVFSLYSAKVMEHFNNPRNVGEMDSPDGTGHVGNPVCGDIMELYIKVKGNIITDVKFKTFGCGAAIATSSTVTEMVKGKSLEEALKISNKAVAEALGGLPAIKMHCSVLAEEALSSAIDDYLAKNPEKNTDTLRILRKTPHHKEE
jgi:nitrogen fixation NifU-like protein